MSGWEGSQSIVRWSFSQCTMETWAFKVHDETGAATPTRGRRSCQARRPQHSYSHCITPKLASYFRGEPFRLAAGLGRRLPAYTLRYRDTLADDIVIQFFPTIRALLYSLQNRENPQISTQIFAALFCNVQSL